MREHVRRTAVPAGQDSVAQLQSDSWVFREIANIISLHPMLSDDPELVVYKPVTHRCASRPARLANYSFKAVDDRQYSGRMVGKNEAGSYRRTRRLILIGRLTRQAPWVIDIQLITLQG